VCGPTAKVALPANGRRNERTMGSGASLRSVRAHGWPLEMLFRCAAFEAAVRATLPAVPQLK
jgi:hypothetical protein